MIRPPASRIGFRLLFPLLFAAVACQMTARAGELWPFIEATPIVSPAPTLTATPRPPSQVPPTTPAPSPTATDIPPSPTPSSTATPSPTPPEPTASPSPLPPGLQAEIFEELWKIVDQEYLYPDFNGLDWDAIHTSYRRKIDAGLSDEAFYLAMEELISRLGDEHSVFLPPAQAAEEDAEFEGEYNFTGIGVLAKAVPERNRAVIIVVFPGSPAQEAGLASHDSILRIDGEPILDEEGQLRNVLRGPEHSLVNLIVQTPGEEPRPVLITRRRIEGPVPVPYSILESPRGKRVGYILLPTFADKTVDDQVGTALQLMSFDDPLEGVILDNRMNEGGMDTVLSGTLAYFTHGELGQFVSRAGERPFRVIDHDMFGSQEVPLVVLIGKDTVSFGEIFAGIFQDNARAYLIGDTTLGNVEILWGYDFRDGSRAWIAHDTFRPANHPNQDWEKTGIAPDLLIPTEWDEVILETDPAVMAALEYLDR